jgi:hypothetical protein
VEEALSGRPPVRLPAKRRDLGLRRGAAEPDHDHRGARWCWWRPGRRGATRAAPKRPAELCDEPQTRDARSGSPVSAVSAGPVVSYRPSGTSPGSPSQPRGIVDTSASSYFRSPPGDTKADCSSADRDQTMRSSPLDLLFEANAQPKAPRSFRWRRVCLGARSRAATRIAPPSGPCVGAVRGRTTELKLLLA